MGTALRNGGSTRASRRCHTAQTRIGVDRRSNRVEKFGAVGKDLKEKVGSPVEL